MHLDMWHFERDLDENCTAHTDLRHRRESVLAKPYHPHHNSGQAARSESSHINCATVRAYVGQVVMVQAKALVGPPG